jgi:hypothetical protein
MPKTYNTIPTTTTGSVYTAAAHNNIVTNVNNYRVPPACRVRRTTNQSIANVTWTVINWNTEAHDTDDMFTATTNQITVQTAGLYLVTASLSFVSNSTGFRIGAIALNPTITGSGDSASVASNFTAFASDARTPAVNGAETAVSLSLVASLAANDKIALIGYQNSGGALNAVSTAQSSDHLSVAWLGQVS